MSDRKNRSDMIEAYLKKRLEKSESVVIKRSEMANLFECVPSQINYVINTRFTVGRGYFVESKRGGMGYIKIVKLHCIEDISVIDEMIDRLPDKLTLKEVELILTDLYSEKRMSSREYLLLLESHQFLDAMYHDVSSVLHPILLKKHLVHLKFLDNGSEMYDG